MNERPQYTAVKSDRVLNLAAAAISEAAWRRLGAKIPETLARQLARIGTVKEMVLLLERRLMVRRTADGAFFDKNSQVRIAAAEIVAEKTGTFDHGTSRGEFIARQVRDERARLLAAEAMRQEGHRFGQFEAEFEAMGHAQRIFFREASRLRARQMARLRAALADSAAYDAASRQLDAIYEKYLLQATALSAPTLWQDLKTKKT